jgi:hypothetical protein
MVFLVCNCIWLIMIAVSMNIVRTTEKLRFSYLPGKENILQWFQTASENLSASCLLVIWLTMSIEELLEPLIHNITCLHGVYRDKFTLTSTIFPVT